MKHIKHQRFRQENWHFKTPMEFLTFQVSKSIHIIRQHEAFVISIDIGNVLCTNKQKRHQCSPFIRTHQFFSYKCSNSGEVVGNLDPIFAMSTAKDDLTPLSTHERKRLRPRLYNTIVFSVRHLTLSSNCLTSK